MQELTAINILIGDRTYRIKIAPQDEEEVRKVVKMINEKVVEYKTQFGGKDMQDYVAMVLVWFATSHTGRSAGEVYNDDLKSSLESIENVLDTALTP